MKFTKCFCRRIAANCADDLRLQQATQFLGVERFFTEAPAGGKEIIFGAADMGVEFGRNVDTNFVGR